VYRGRKLFAITADEAMGDLVRADGACAVELWSALANVEWRGPNGEAIFYSFRQAGELVAWIREEGDELDWYGSGEPGVVVDWIADALAPRGWHVALDGMPGTA
jgi:hypothetical protein